MSFNIKNFDQILRGIFGPATFCFTAVLSAAKAISMLLSTSNLSDSNKISNKTFQLSFISLKSIRYHCVTMYTCSNVERIIISRIIISFFTQKNLSCEHKLLRKCVCGLGSNMTPHTYAIF